MGRIESSFDITPSARRLTASLRDIGYDFVAALADVVDNSVAAQASEVEIDIVFDGAHSYVVIADNGLGMSERSLGEALRFGSRREYAVGELGRYGLGLKTASLSQCRRVSVASRQSQTYKRITVRTLDIDHIETTDRWEIIDAPAGSEITNAKDRLASGPGTLVVWENLDRVLPEKDPEGGWARRRLDGLARKSGDYLGMVFHRFIEQSAARQDPLVITVNGEKVQPWNPFAPLEENQIELPSLSHEVLVGRLHGRVHLHRYVLPSRAGFSSMSEFERLSGPKKWNRQQGLYIYRADRLVQHGGWSGIRALDEHTKLARAALDFQTDLDTLFQINVAKMRVAMPPEVRTLFEKPIQDLCHHADAVYRRDADSRKSPKGPSESAESVGSANTSTIGAALLAASLESGEHQALTRIMDQLRSSAPDVASSLGW